MPSLDEIDIPESFETKRLLIRAPRPGDGTEVNAAVVESLESLRPWMEWAQTAPSVEESEENLKRAREAYLDKSGFRMLLFRKGTRTHGRAARHTRLFDDPGGLAVAARATYYMLA